MTKAKFKDKYILAEGYPWALGVGPQYNRLCMNKTAIGVDSIWFNFPVELWGKDIPKYKLILRKVKP